MNTEQLNEMLLNVGNYPGSNKRENHSLIECEDGATISIQASAYHYCSPRDNVGPWTMVEAGYPSVKPHEAMMKYCDEPDNPTETVYGYVPIQLAVDFINNHGGIKPK